MNKSNHVKGIICALLANVIFGFSFIFSKTALLASHPLVILAARFTIAFIFINILLVFGAFKIT
jgi:drug/metabolite transporter (DMT)-like permease